MNFTITLNKKNRRLKFFTLVSLVLCFLIFSTLSSSLYSQNSENRIKLLISSRVDTSDKNVREVLTLYENYFNSKPDSIYNNPYWNTHEKELYYDFDFSRASIFQGGMKPEQLAQIYPPFILSVEPIQEKYQVRILFSSSITDEKYVGSKVWCIQKLNAVKQDDKWLLENLIVEITKNWKSETVGFIKYIFPNSLDFNKKRALEAEDFCKEIIKTYHPNYKDSLTFFLTDNIDEMGLLENFDYYFVGMTKGKAGNGKITSASGDAFYPHEFIHALLPENDKRGYIIDEGLAVFLGTKENLDEYNGIIKKLSADLKAEKINFESVVSQKIRFNGYQTAYPAGAVICEIIYKHKGTDGIKQLIAEDTSNYNNIINTITKITDLQLEEFVAEWNEFLINQ
ncbi:MAG: hypothetical protein K0B10_11505 [Vicingaceae bacterium]|nr:hypothetical protein [Vicingaceae bacterium]